MRNSKSHGRTGTRSTKGCWTCRLRRKKCDETHPSCHMCESLKIACEGYGPKPLWMDRGPREREEAQKIKTQIAKQFPGNRRSGLSRQGSKLSSLPVGVREAFSSSDKESRGLEVAANVGVQQEKEPDDSLDRACSLQEGYEGERFNDKISSYETGWLGAQPAISVGIVNTSLPEMFSPPDPLYDIEYWNFEMDGCTSANKVLSSLSQYSEDSAIAMMSINDDSSNRSTSMGTGIEGVKEGVGLGIIVGKGCQLKNTVGDCSTPPPDKFLTYNSHFDIGDWSIASQDYASIADPLNRDFQRHSRGQSMPDIKNSTLSADNPRYQVRRSLLPPPHALNLSSDVPRQSIPPSSNNLQSCSGERLFDIKPLTMSDALLLSHYSEEVLPAQFPFSERGGRQWLQFLIFSSKSMMEISLAASRSYHELDLNSTNRETLNNYEDNLARVMGILKTLPSPTATMALVEEEQKILQSLVACASLLQTIFLEMFHGESHYWRECLQQAAPYMQVIIGLAVRSQASTNTPSNSVSQIQTTAAKTLLGHLVWFDLLATLSSGTDHLLGIDHNYLLGLDSLAMVEICGCENWNVKALCDSVALNTWKKQAERDGRLSIVELVTQGAAILQPLSNFITQQSDIPSPQVQSDSRPSRSGTLSSVLDCWKKDVRSSIGLVFARATVIYLHVTLSGPNPHLAEIRQEVAELVNLFGVLARKGMIRYASWPLCVAACFADKEQKQALREWVSVDGNGTQTGVASICMKALDIADECQRMREEEGKNVDWISSMNSSRKCILLG